MVGFGGFLVSWDLVKQVNEDCSQSPIYPGQLVKFCHQPCIYGFRASTDFLDGAGMNLWVIIMIVLTQHWQTTCQNSQGEHLEHFLACNGSD